MKAVLMSIQPYWVFLIIARKMGWHIDKDKTIEVRKNFPKDQGWSRTVEIYCSKDKKSFSQIPKKYQPLMKKFLGKVIGEFVCDRIAGESETIRGNTGLSVEELQDYCDGKDIYGWHISDLKIYEEPKELGEFFHACKQPSGTDCSKCIDRREKTCYSITRPPQSWCYVEELQE